MIPACEAFDDIRARMLEIAKANEPHCPIHPTITLYNCLRMSEASKCSEYCPHKEDWLGPQ